MSLVATPRRAPFAERQLMCAPPSVLTIDLVSPTPQQRKKLHQQASSLSQSKSQLRTTSASAPKRARDDDTENCSGVKRTRLQNPVVPSQTAENIELNAPATPPQRTATLPAADTMKPAKRRQKHTKEERIEREKAILVFKEKYTRVFPSFSFYFHGLEASHRKVLISKVLSLGARVEDFFSSSVTHVVSNRPWPAEEEAERLAGNKENISQAPPTNLWPSVPLKPPSRLGHPNALRSPIKLRSASSKAKANDNEAVSYDPLIIKAIQLRMKLWDTNKLESILSRLLSLPPDQSKRNAVLTRASKSPTKVVHANSKQTVTLSQLLRVEKQSGVTYERDPNTKRPDYDYFPKNSFFLMVYDCDEVYAPVAIKDYGRWKKGDKPGWPVLNLDGVGYSNRSRAPVFGWKPEIDFPNEGRAQNPAEDRVPTAGKVFRKPTDLRKTASMYNLGRKKPPAENADTSARLPSTRDVSNLLPSASIKAVPHVGASRPSIASAGSTASVLPSQAYIAASGNSAVITSNVGSTTSTAGFLHLGGSANAKLAAGVIGKRVLHQQVLTNRTFGKPMAAPSTTSLGNKENMPPPAEPQDEISLPSTSKAAGKALSRPCVLKKSKSTNTLRLPPREEAKKPGYCENCRCKFEDFAK
ncbi:hypothetical protein FRB99_007338, partial [Tulasnella sp. 403]